MENKNTCVCNSILTGVGILLLLAAAFDILPWPDNVVIFTALVCFVMNGIIAKIAKSASNCCK
ncbi:MAG: hypothetical protein PHC29_08740 [Candidatus Omnitrophica bacterium]|nr:hypothetical protein [Candidatus Omnitrophota bacterium]